MFKELSRVAPQKRMFRLSTVTPEKEYIMRYSFEWSI